jgi:hypothetical protein
MNGFQPRPQLSQGDIARLERICDRVIAGEPGADLKLCDWTDRIAQKLGGQKRWEHWYVNYSTADLGHVIARKLNEAMLSILPPDLQAKMHESAQGNLVSVLRDDGFELGKDFSLDGNGGFLLSKAATEKVKAGIPSELWTEFEGQGLIKSQGQCPWKAVEKRLDVPFRQNLMSRLSELVEQGRSAAVIVGWMVNINCGVANQVMGNDDDSTLFQLLATHLEIKHPQAWPDIEAEIFGGEYVDGDELLDMDINCLRDVAIAAGSSEENGELKGDGMNRACMERLALVWRGDRLSMTEFIGLYDKEMAAR